MSETTPDTRTEIPEADVAAFIAKHGKPYDPATDDYRRPLFAAPIKAGKNTAIYNAHSYHTKVPPQGIVPYIQHYTEPGDLVLDPFCGSGMTGVAALMSGRCAILNDLSPAAVHIARNYCAPVRHRRAACRVRANQGSCRRGVRLAVRHLVQHVRRSCHHPFHCLERCARVWPLWAGIDLVGSGRGPRDLRDPRGVHVSVMRCDMA